MTVTAAFCPLSLQTIFDANGRAISGAKLYFYDSGTTTPRSVYRDADLSRAYPFPVLTDGFGRVPPIYVDINPYKVVVKDASNAQLYTADPLPGATEPAPAPAPGATGWATGDLKLAYTDNAQDDWVVCNGLTIGNAASGATSRADPDTQDLFAALWNADATLVVTGGRGANASADYAAAKAITLPDFRGRTFAGVDGMGNSLASILTSATVANPNNIGATGGAETVALSTSTVPSTITTTVANHALSIDELPSHAHAITDPGHAHGITDPGHTHSYRYAIQDSAGAGGAGTFLFHPDDGHATGNTATGVSVNIVATGVSEASVGSDQGHAHTATSALSGTPAAHANLQPTILGYVFVKL